MDIDEFEFRIDMILADTNKTENNNGYL